MSKPMQPLTGNHLRKSQRQSVIPEQISRLSLLQKAAADPSLSAKFIKEGSLFDWLSTVGRAFRKRHSATPNSLQRRVIDAYVGTTGEDQLSKELVRAQETCDAAIQEAALKSLTGSSKFATVNFETTAIRMIASVPGLIAEMESLFPGGKAPPLNATFILKVANEIKKHQRRGTAARISRHALVLAQFWTSPEFPLWLMSNRAGGACLNKLLGGGYVKSEGNFATLARRSGLKRASKPPIKEITKWQGGRICEFSLAGDLPRDVAENLAQLPETRVKK